MDRLSLIVGAAVLVGASSSAFGGFITPAAPAGVAGIAGGGGGTFTPAGPTALEGLLEKAPFARVPGPVLPGAPQTTAALRFGPGAARALAGGVARGLIPGVGLALGVAWLASNCFEKQDGQWVRTCGPGLVVPPQSDGYEYSPTVISPAEWLFNPDLACARALQYRQQHATAPYTAVAGNPIYTSSNGVPNNCNIVMMNGTQVWNQTGWNVTLARRSQSCPAGWYKTDSGCSYTFPKPVVTAEQIEDEMAPKDLPPVVPQGFPYPLLPQAPFVFNPDTAKPPNGQPLRAPQGLPQPIPNTSPQQYQQPVTRFVPAPTVAEPTRLDAQPETVTGTDPQGITSPQTPSGTTTDGKPPEQFDLCKEHPDIIACQVFKPDDLQPLPVPNENKPLSITPDGGWGASTASCPADKSASLSFGPIAFSYEPLCLFANGIRPMVIALAWFSAALTFFGFARKDT